METKNKAWKTLSSEYIFRRPCLPYARMSSCYPQVTVFRSIIFWNIRIG